MIARMPDRTLAAALHPPAPAARRPQRSALALGCAGALGEELLTLLVADSGYRQVAVGVTQAMGSTAARFSPWVVGQGLPVVDEAWICVTGAETFVPAASPIYRVDEAGLVAAARLARDCGARKLVVVAPLAALLQMNAGAQSISGADELALVGMGFDELLIVRPTAAGTPAGAGWPRRLVQAAARALADIMLPQYARALSAESAARAIVAAAQQTRRGVRVLGARDLLRLIESRWPRLAPGKTRLR